MLNTERTLSMKKASLILGTAILLTATAWMINSCDKIEEPYIVKKIVVDTAQCPVPEFPVVTSTVKRILLEDYTGHTCVNCPRAAVTAHELSEEYGNKLVIIAVHAGYFAKPLSAPFDYDFRTAAGTDWDNFFGIGKVGNPNGMVNRGGYPSQHILSPSAWGNALDNAIDVPPLAELQVIGEYEESSSKLCIHTKTSFLQNISNREIKLSVVIVEDSIIQPQKNNDAQVGSTPQINDYVHMHVLRGAVNASWGDKVLEKSTVSGSPVIKSYQTQLESFGAYEMQPDKCRIIAFLYDGETFEVLQVTETALTE